MTVRRKFAFFYFMHALRACFASYFLFMAFAHAQEGKEPAPETEEVDVDVVKQKYWAKGKEAQLGVVQDRRYSKNGKFKIGFAGGVVFSDPFLTINPAGGNIGYHFSEFIGLSLVAQKMFVRDSSALEKFKEEKEGTINTNEPVDYLAAELTGSIIYGKLSLLGSRIIYYDLYTAAGVGLTNTESGRFITPSLGIGQRFFLNKITSLTVDYRLQYFRETIREKEITNKLGQDIGKRSNWGSAITVGLDFFFGGSK